MSTQRSDDLRVIAIDWSGAQAPSVQKKKIWLAEIQNGAMSRLQGCWTRESLIVHLLSLGEVSHDLIVGLDFAFSFPSWFCDEHGARSPQEFWRMVDEKGDSWLHKNSRRCPPFWGWKDTTKLKDKQVYRATECELRKRRLPLKSAFQVAGSGAVGTGSIRGIPKLLELRQAGFSIWPFTPPRLPLVVEIYPRALLQAEKPSQPCERERYLDTHHLDLADLHRGKAIASDDAFDATISALSMWEHREDLLNLPSDTEHPHNLEGKIWTPTDQVKPNC